MKASIIFCTQKESNKICHSLKIESMTINGYKYYHKYTNTELTIVIPNRQKGYSDSFIFAIVMNHVNQIFNYDLMQLIVSIKLQNIGQIMLESEHFGFVKHFLQLDFNNPLVLKGLKTSIDEFINEDEDENDKGWFVDYNDVEKPETLIDDDEFMGIDEDDDDNDDDDDDEFEDDEEENDDDDEFEDDEEENDDESNKLINNYNNLLSGKEIFDKYFNQQFKEKLDINGMPLKKGTVSDPPKDEHKKRVSGKPKLTPEEYRVRKTIKSLIKKFKNYFENNNSDVKINVIENNYSLVIFTDKNNNERKILSMIFHTSGDTEFPLYEITLLFSNNEETYQKELTINEEDFDIKFFDDIKELLFIDIKEYQKSTNWSKKI
jgi:hypothetical protein